MLSGSLPLLRGAGMVNLEGLISSERQLVYSVRGFEIFRRSFAVTVASSYFNLLARQRSVDRPRSLQGPNGRPARIGLEGRASEWPPEISRITSVARAIRVSQGKLLTDIELRQYDDHRAGQAEP